MSTSEGIEQETQSQKPDLDPPPDLVPDGHPGLCSGYTYQEVAEALSASTEVVCLAKEVGKSVYKLVLAAIAFRDRGYYRWLGLDSFNEWYVVERFSPTSISRYIRVYEAMTIRNNIPLDAYESLDLARTDGFLKIISAGASAEQLKAALEVARDLGCVDWNQWAKDAAANIKAGREMGDPTPLPAPEVRGDERTSL